MFREEIEVKRVNYLNRANTLSTSLSGLPHEAPGSTSFPQKPHLIPSLFRKGLWEAQVPLNSPFFKKMSRTDMPTKNKAIRPSVKNKVAIIEYFDAKITFLIS